MTWAAAQLFGPLFDESVTPARIRALAERLPEFALMGAFGMLVLSAVTVTLHALYANLEMQLLLSAPVRPQSVFFGKFVDILVANASLFAMLGGPVIAAYAHARGLLSVEYALRACIGLAAFCVLPTALGAVAAIVMMRFLPANRMRELLGAVGLAGLAAGYVALSVAARRLHEPQAAVGAARVMLDVLSSPAASTGPWAWAGSVIASPPGYPEAYEPLAKLCVAAPLAALAGASIAAALHWRGWTGAQEAGGQTTRRTPSGLLLETLLAWMPGPPRAYLAKDLRSLGRDLRQLSLLLMPAAVVVVLLLNMGTDPQTRSAPPALLSLILLPVVGMIALRIASSAFVGETNALLVALASPAGARNVLIGKLWYTASLSSGLALAAASGYGLMLGLSPGEWGVSLGMTLAGTIALSGIGVGIGARSLELAPDGARASLAGATRMLTLGLQLAYSAVVAAIAILAWALAEFTLGHAAIVYALAGAAIAALSAVTALAPIALGAARLSRIGD
jgi:hypothetical protein